MVNLKCRIAALERSRGDSLEALQIVTGTNGLVTFEERQEIRAAKATGQRVNFIQINGGMPSEFYEGRAGGGLPIHGNEFPMGYPPD